MIILELTPEYEDLYFHCLEDWSDEIKEAGEHKKHWYLTKKEQGLRVKLALDEAGAVGGMIQYLPIEHSFLEGQGLYFIHCVWVHGHKQGRGNFQGKGMGQALIRAAEEDAAALGAKGMAAWGVALPFFMKASWFKKQGYRAADRDGISVLLWKPFAPEGAPPKWVRRRGKMPALIPGKVVVAGFVNGWCPAQNMVFERAKRAVMELGDRVEFQEYRTLDPEVFAEWGITDGVFVDGKQIRSGPPPSYDKIKGIIAERVRRVKG